MPGAWLILPTYNEAENLEPIVRAALPQLARDRARAPRSSSWTTARPTAPARSPTGWPRSSTTVRGAPPPAQAGPRARLPGRLRARARRRRRAGARDGRRLLARPRRPAAADRGAATTPTWCSARATCRAAAWTNWGALRRLLSAAAARCTRASILGVPVRDLTGGFKCFRREVLEALDLDGVHADGYGFQIELTYRAIKAGFTREGGPDRVSRPPRGAVEDDRADRARGGLEGARSAVPAA